MDKIVIVMPAYNEAENLKLMIPELFEKYFPEIKNAQMHLLIVDDYSPDKSGELIKDLMKKYSNLHLLQKQKEGLGWAYIRGFQYAIEKLNADAVMEMDADYQHPPRFVKPMVEAYLNGAEYCIGSRYIKGGSIPKEWALPRKLVSFFGNLFIRICLLNFKIHDLTTGFRLMKVNGVLDQIDLEHLMHLERFAYKTDLLYQCMKLAKKTVEVPLEFANRTKEKSKFNWLEFVTSLKVAIILGIKDKQKLIKFAIVGGTGFVVNFLFLRVFRYLGLSELFVWIFATELAIVNNYIFNNIWTFKDSEIKGLKAMILKFLQFNLTSAGALIIQSIAGPIGTRLIGEKYDFIVLALVILLFVMPYNYLMYTKVIWKKKK